MFQDTTTGTVLTCVPCHEEEVTLRITGKGQDLTIYCNDDLLCHVDGRRINPEELGPMTGTMVGMFAAADEEEKMTGPLLTGSATTKKLNRRSYHGCFSCEFYV